MGITENWSIAYYKLLYANEYVSYKFLYEIEALVAVVVGLYRNGRGITRRREYNIRRK